MHHNGLARLAVHVLIVYAFKPIDTQLNKKVRPVRHNLTSDENPGFTQAKLMTDKHWPTNCEARVEYQEFRIQMSEIYTGIIKQAMV